MTPPNTHDPCFLEPWIHRCTSELIFIRSWRVTESIFIQSCRVTESLYQNKCHSFSFYLAQSFPTSLQLNAISSLTQFSHIISLLVWLTRYTGYRLRMTHFPPRRIALRGKKYVGSRSQCRVTGVDGACLWLYETRHKWHARSPSCDTFGAIYPCTLLNIPWRCSWATTSSVSWNLSRQCQPPSGIPTVFCMHRWPLDTAPELIYLCLHGDSNSGQQLCAVPGGSSVQPREHVLFILSPSHLLMQPWHSATLYSSGYPKESVMLGVTSPNASMTLLSLSLNPMGIWGSLWCWAGGSHLLMQLLHSSASH